MTSSVSSRAALRSRGANVALATVLAMLTVFGPVSMDLYLPVLPSLAADLRTGASAAQLTMTACLVGLALGQIVFGPISDRLGRRGLLLVGVVLYIATSLLCAISTSIELLIVLRVLQGLAGGIGLVIAQAAGRDVYEGTQLTRYYGRIVVLSGLAAIVAPAVGGLLAAHMDWRGFFVVLAGIGGIILVAVVFGLPETLPAEERVAGGFARTREHFGILRRDPTFVGATIASSFTSAAYFAYLAGASFVLQDIFELSPGIFSIVFAANAAGFALFGFLGGRLSERWGERKTFLAGLTLLGTGVALLSVSLLVEPSLGFVLAGFLLIAGGAAAVSPPSTTLALRDYPDFAGTASSVLGVARFATGAVAAPLVGLGGSHEIAPLIVVAAVGVVGSAASFLLLVPTSQPVLAPIRHFRRRT